MEKGGERAREKVVGDTDEVATRDPATGPKRLTRTSSPRIGLLSIILPNLIPRATLPPPISISLFGMPRHARFNSLTVQSLQVRLACVDQLPGARVELVQDILQKQPPFVNSP